MTYSEEEMTTLRRAAEMALEECRFDEARKLLRILTEIDPGKTELENLDTADDYDTLCHLKKLSNRFPENIEASLALARIFAKMGKWANVVLLYDELLSGDLAEPYSIKIRTKRLLAEIRARRFRHFIDDFWIVFDCYKKKESGLNIIKSILHYIASIDDNNAKNTMNSIIDDSRCGEKTKRFLKCKIDELSALEALSENLIVGKTLP